MTIIDDLMVSSKDAALQNMKNKQPVVIAEIKRASPSKGDIGQINDPVKLALEYQEMGAWAISVLTESTQFKGSLEDLRKVARAVNIPVLRKEFISTKFQIKEAFLAGASLVLLIVRALNDNLLKELFSYAKLLGLNVLVECHNEVEINKALELLDAKIIGINTRNLADFSVDQELFAKLASKIPEDCIKVAESGVKDYQDIENYGKMGADVVLVGEAFVKGMRLNK